MLSFSWNEVHSIFQWLQWICLLDPILIFHQINNSVFLFSSFQSETGRSGNFLWTVWQLKENQRHILHTQSNGERYLKGQIKINWWRKEQSIEIAEQQNKMPTHMLCDYINVLSQLDCFFVVVLAVSSFRCAGCVRPKCSSIHYKSNEIL